MKLASRRLARLSLIASMAAALTAAAYLGLAPASATPGARATSSTTSADPAPFDDDSARSLQDAFTTVAEEVSPSVVRVEVETRAPMPSNPFGLVPHLGPNQGIVRGGGSGVVLDPDGFILTNNHVVDGATRVSIRLHDGRTFPARIVGTDPATDIAVLHIEATGLRAARFASSEDARVGQWVVAIGSPFGLDYTVTTGVLSAKGRGGLGANEIEDYLQTAASINPGNSGGPLVDLDGRVLGINTMIIGRGTGIGFAVPSDLVQNVAHQIVENGVVRRAWLGVGFQEITPELAAHFEGRERGALVSSVVSGGPADRAGIRPGDVVVAVDGAPVVEGHDLLHAVLRKPVGERMRLSVVRGASTVAVTVVTGERPGTEETNRPPTPEAPNAEGTRFGLALRPLTPAMRARLRLGDLGEVVVSGVAPGSPAERSGIRPGDVVLEADRHEVHRPEDVRRALADGAALLRITRAGGFLFVALEASDEAPVNAR